MQHANDMLFHCIVYLWQNNICDMAATGNLVLRLQNINKATKSHVINDWKRLIVKNNELGKHLCYLFGSRVISCHFLSSCNGLLQGWLLSANVTASGKFSVLTFVFPFQMFYHITRIISTAFCTSSWYFCRAKFAVCHVWVVIINVEIFPHCWAWHSVAAAGVSVHWKFPFELSRDITENSPLWELLPSNVSWRPIGSRQSNDWPIVAKHANMTSSRGSINAAPATITSESFSSLCWT